MNLFGPTDLAGDPADASPQAIRSVERLVGADLDSSLNIRIAASPIRYVRAAGPAVFTVHGDTDELVPVSQARALDAAMASVGQKHVYLEIPGMPHGAGAIWIGPYAQLFRFERLRFLAEYL